MGVDQKKAIDAAWPDDQPADKRSVGKESGKSPAPE